MRRLEKEGFKYKDYCLGDLVLYENTQAKIIGFDIGNGVNNYIALEVSDEIINHRNLNKKNIQDSNVDKLIYINSPKNYFMWAYPKEIKPLHKNKSPFKVGQRVWDFSRGYGTVNRIIDDEEDEYPVVVLFDDSDASYFTIDGRYYKRHNRTLFFEEIPIPESALKSKRWRAVKGCEYFFISTQGSIETTCEDNFKIDNERHKSGNYFRTEEDAESSVIYKAFQESKE